MLGRLLITIAAAVFVWAVLSFMKRRQAALAKRASRQLDNASKKPNIIYFWSDGCHVCRNTQKRILEEVIAEYDGERLTFVAYDVDKEPDAAKEWGVRTLPTTFLVDSTGAVRFVNNGLVAAEKLRLQLKSFLD